VQEISTGDHRRTFDEGHHFFRFRPTMQQHISLANERRLFCYRLDTLEAMVLIASTQSKLTPARHVVFCILSSDASKVASIDDACTGSGFCQMAILQVVYRFQNGNEHDHDERSCIERFVVVVHLSRSVEASSRSRICSKVTVSISPRA
jgi:hypothetical protein